MSLVTTPRIDGRDQSQVLAALHERLAAYVPGFVPADFSRSTVHVSGDGGVSELAPRASCAAVMSAVPMRFVNQLESGTSSVVLTLAARPERRGFAARL